MPCQPLALALALALLAAPALAQQSPQPPASEAPHSPPELRGMTVPLHSKDPAYDYGPSLKELPGLGVRQVCVTFHVYQARAHSPTPTRHPTKTPSDGTIRTVIKQAQALGLEVALLPIVLIEHPGEHEWRGNLSPPDTMGRRRGDAGYQGPDWRTWFRGYGQLLRHYARLGEECRVSILSVGSELSSSEGEASRWRALIGEVRELFSGELTYSANWDHYQHVSFWSALDYVGLSGYYELTRDTTPSLSELLGAWRRVRAQLLTWRTTAGLERKPLLFTELGYPSIDGCASKPWDYTAKTPPDLLEQAACYEAFVRCWDGRPELGGVFFYEWWGEGGPQDGHYTPRGKPALSVLKGWFGGE